MSSIASTVQRDGAMRLAAFAGLSGLAAWRYAGIETRPPIGRVATLAALAIIGGLALMLIRAPEQGRPKASSRLALTRVLVIAALLAVSLVAAGIPAHLLLPTAWPKLAHDVYAGLTNVTTTLWPYSGQDSWTRVDLLLAIAVVPLAAAGLAFWPAGDCNRRAALPLGIRRFVALGLLLCLYVVGVLDSNGGSATVEGLLLLLLVVGWVWLPGLRGGRVLAAAPWLALAALFAIALAGQLSANPAWLDYRAWDVLGGAKGGTAFSWDQTYGPIPWSRSQQTMFTVRAVSPLLWKVTTLDRFDGLRFVRSGINPGVVNDLPLPLNDRWYAFARFQIAGLRSTLLPTEQGTTAAVNFAHRILYEPDGTVQAVSRSLRGGDMYTVMSYAPRPSPAELRSAPRKFPPAYLRYTDFDLPAPGQSGLRIDASDPANPGRFSSVRTVGSPAPGLSPAAAPRLQRRILASPYGPMYRLAHRLGAGKRTSYDVAQAIETYLKANYIYSERSPARRYPLEAFLFTDRIGYCQQFSGGMALMLRMDGIPARVAAGFLPGSYDSTARSFQVRAVDAHSWVEVYFSGIGWVPFDPTPPRTVATPQRPLFTSQTSVSSLDAVAATVGGPLPLASVRTPARHRPKGGGAGADGPLEVASAGIALVGLLMLATRWLTGFARLRRSLDGDGELAAIELVRALPRLGYPLPATVTLIQVEGLVRVHGGADAARYVRLLRERRYAPRTPPSVSLRDRRLLRARLTRPLGLDVRLRGLWVLPPAALGWRARHL